MRRRAVCAAAAALPPRCAGHGQLTHPPGRNGGSLSGGGYCRGGSCMWFSQPVEIPGEPTLNAARLRTANVNISAGPRDWSRRHPWRAPGTAPVYGSGCGAAGGGPVQMANGGHPPPGVAQGADFLTLPPRAAPAARWRRGAEEEVAWSITANHAGGYSYRLCAAAAAPSEACFQRAVLRFAGARQWLQYGDVYQNGRLVGAPGASRAAALPRFEIPAVRVARGTHPEGSEWTRNPVPPCLLCDQGDCAGTWVERQACAQACHGLNLTSCPPGMTEFAEPAPGVSGYSGCCSPAADAPPRAFPYSIVDRVMVPTDLPPGPYLLSWRWDCEQSQQVWQNCADVVIE